jgi:hypothetical protein
VAGREEHSRPGGRKKGFPELWTNRINIVAYLWKTNYAAMQQIPNWLISGLKSISKNPSQSISIALRH